MIRRAIYAGTFDPMTLGHLDVIERAAKTVDELVVGVAAVTGKSTLFDQAERVAMVREVLGERDDVIVEPFHGLLVDYAADRDAAILIRGLRAFSDFEYEFQMALTNRRLAPDLETLFLMPKQDYSFVSSSNVKQIASLGGKVSDFVPVSVEEALRRKYA